MLGLKLNHVSKRSHRNSRGGVTVYPKKYAHCFVVLCFVVVMQSFIMNSHEVFIHIHQGCFAGTVAIVRLPQCQWSKPDGYGKISQCITTTKHSKAKTVCIFLGIYCRCHYLLFAKFLLPADLLCALYMHPIKRDIDIQRPETLSKESFCWLWQYDGQDRYFQKKNARLLHKIV